MSMPLTASTTSVARCDATRRRLGPTGSSAAAELAALGPGLGANASSAAASSAAAASPPNAACQPIACDAIAISGTTSRIAIDQPLTMRPITCPRRAKLDRSPAYA